MSLDLLLIVKYFLTGYSVKLLVGSFFCTFSVVEHNQNPGVNISCGQLLFALLFFNTVSMRPAKGFPIKKYLGSLIYLEILFDWL